MAIGTKFVKVNGKVYKYPRNYVTEYSARSSTQKHNRTIRRRARNSMIKSLGVSAIRGKDVDHIHGIGGGNSKKNLRVTSIHFNRARKSTRWR